MRDTAMAWYQQAEENGDLQALERAITIWAEIAAAAPADFPECARFYCDLGIALQTRFERTGSLTDLHEAISRFREAVSIVLVDDPARAGYLTNLGNALRVGYERTNRLADLEEATARLGEACDITPAGDPNRYQYLGNLSLAYQARFRSSGNLVDIDKAVQVGRDAVEDDAALDFARSHILSILASALQMRFERTGWMQDLEQGIALLREAAEGCPTGSTSRGRYLSRLATALRLRFENAGQAADLDEAVAVLRQAENTASSYDPYQGMRLASLALVLRIRYEYTGEFADLEAAIDAAQKSVDALPVGDPDRPGELSNLAGVLRLRYEHSGDLADLDAAIRVGHEAVDTSPASYYDRAGYLTNLGTALRLRFEATGNAADLDSAVRASREAVEVAPDDFHERAIFLAQLSSALRTRFEQSHNPADLEEAIVAVQHALAMTLPDHPHRARLLFNLGGLLRLHYLSTQMSESYEAAVEAFSEAARSTSAAPWIRIVAGRACGHLNAQANQWQEASAAFREAVRLLPLAVPRQVQWETREHWLEAFSGIASDAAASALQVEDTQSAVELLEMGRGVLIAQALDARSDLTELRAVNPELAEEFVQLRDRLDTSAPIGGTGTAELRPDRGTQIDRGGSSADEFYELILRIRRQPGLASFCAQPRLAELQTEASQGPIVMINISQFRCDALILTAEKARVVPLTGLTLDEVRRQVTEFLIAVHSVYDTSLPPSTRQHVQYKISDVLAWEWDSIVGPVLDAIGYTGIPAPGKAWPRIWWSPGGLLGFLPLHAAGHHEESGRQSARTAIDRVASSYTPTVRALSYARGRAPATEHRVLVVSMPQTPGAPDLEGARQEGQLLSARFPGALVLMGHQATHDRVLAELADHTIVHFACHGISDPQVPARSRLLLQDHLKHPLTVAEIAQLDLTADLAYLSACDTAAASTWRQRLADEAIHLTTAFQIAGYAHVISNLWSATDELSAEITAEVYRQLVFNSESLNIARAVHSAAYSIRNRFPDAPTLWAGLIHVGALRLSP